MSRTYREFPVVKDNKRHSKKWSRNQANRRVRHNPDISDGCSYKRLYQQWDICDHWSYCTLNDWLDRSVGRYGVTIQDAVRKWKKQYYWK